MRPKSGLEPLLTTMATNGSRTARDQKPIREPGPRTAQREIVVPPRLTVLPPKPNHAAGIPIAAIHRCRGRDGTAAGRIGGCGHGGGTPRGDGTARQRWPWRTQLARLDGHEEMQSR
jgi:hypothetical protein